MGETATRVINRGTPFERTVSERVHRAGELAYLDTIGAGLVPCKVLAVERANGAVVLTVGITADRAHYRRGDRLTSNTRHAVPRSEARGPRSMYGPTIRGGWRWVLDR